MLQDLEVITMLYIVLGTFLIWAAPILGDREHKVHNIVLYPERHSWCQTTPIKQVVALPGYESMTIDNNVCVGACYSYSIPRTQPAEPGELIGPYCDSCQPINTKCYHVNLRADEKNEDGPRMIQKRVQIITNCTCLSCDKIQTSDCEITDEGTAELPADLFAMLYGNSSLLTFNSSYDDVKELLNLPKDRTDINPNTTNMKDEQKLELKMKLVQMLKNLIEVNMAKQENSVLLQLIGILENAKSDVSPKNLISLFNSVSDEDVNIVKIKEILLRHFRDRRQPRRSLQRETHRNGDPGDTNRYEQDPGGDPQIPPAPFRLGMGIQETPTDTNKIPEGIHRSHPHHFVGQVQTVGLDTGHLMKGPHDSLVLVPNVKVEKKLHIESDEVQPNQEGVVIEYENHPRDSHLVHFCQGEPELMSNTTLLEATSLKI
ncbi:DAN domain [Popillia japonica]|uniref:DAN domain n=1 Tax=Popillia japonica TaxID=7064 RepID=A0AAW1MKM0_POPJA